MQQIFQIQNISARLDYDVVMVWQGGSSAPLAIVPGPGDRWGHITCLHCEQGNFKLATPTTTINLLSTG